jgi:acylphosphatase
MSGLDAPAEVRRHVWVSGRVQNVWFRDSCVREATARGVGGWVRNLADRRVEAVFEGEPEAVEGMVAWSHIGPAHACVESIERFTETPEGLVGFNVVH